MCSALRSTTGRNGHAPGGIWLHFAIGGGFLYTGDYSAKSMLYAYDPPAKPAATALIDCSYADYQKPLAECWNELAPFVERGPLLLPVPANGRGPEIALELMRHGVVRHLCRRRHAEGAAAVATAPHFAARRPCRRRHQSGSPQSSSRSTARAASCSRLRRRHVRRDHAARSESKSCRGNDPVHRLRQSDHAGGAADQERPRANHALERAPAASDTVALVRATQAKTVIPAFCDRAKVPALAAALAPARVTTKAAVPMGPQTHNPPLARDRNEFHAPYPRETGKGGRSSPPSCGRLNFRESCAKSSIGALRNDEFLGSRPNRTTKCRRAAIAAAVFLVLTIGVEAEAMAKVRRVIADIGGLVRAVGFRDLKGRLSCNVGIGNNAWDRLRWPRPSQGTKKLCGDLRLGPYGSRYAGRPAISHSSGKT